MIINGTIASQRPAASMFSATRRWLRRYRTPIAVGLGVVGAGYVATQYVLSKINDARERMSSDRIAKEKYVPPLSARMPGRGRR